MSVDICCFVCIQCQHLIIFTLPAVYRSWRERRNVSCGWQRQQAFSAQTFLRVPFYLWREIQHAPSAQRSSGKRVFAVWRDGRRRRRGRLISSYWRWRGCMLWQPGLLSALLPHFDGRDNTIERVVRFCHLSSVGLRGSLPILMFLPGRMNVAAGMVAWAFALLYLHGADDCCCLFAAV